MSRCTAGGTFNVIWSNVESLDEIQQAIAEYLQCQKTLTEMVDEKKKVNRRTDGQTDGQTDRRTDRRMATTIAPYCKQSGQKFKILRQYTKIRNLSEISESFNKITHL